MDALASSSTEPPSVHLDMDEDIALFEYTGGTTGPAQGGHAFPRGQPL